MEPKVFKCALCGVSRSSKFALKRHQRGEHPSSTSTAGPSERPVPATTTAPSGPCADDTRTVTTAATRKSKPGGHRHDRSVIDQVVRQLQSRHQRHPSYLQKSSAEIVHDLQRGTRGHKPDQVVYLAIAVTAKVFASVGRHVPHAVRRVRVAEPPAETREPRRQSQLIVTPTGIVQAARRQGRRGDRSLDPVRRVLFQSAEPTTTHSAPELPLKDPEEDWRRCIWHSYMTQRIKPPSPMGFRWAPAAIFASPSAAAPPVSPVKAGYVTWGPDSPDQPLEEDTVPEVPGWPMFQEDGELLRRDSPRWKARLLVWRHERSHGSPLQRRSDEAYPVTSSITNTLRQARNQRSMMSVCRHRRRPAWQLC